MSLTAPSQARFHFDTSPAGAGVRLWIVLSVGRRYAVLVYLPGLIRFRLPLDEATRSLRAGPAPITARTRARIRRRLRDARRSGDPLSAWTHRLARAAGL